MLRFIETLRHIPALKQSYSRQLNVELTATARELVEHHPEAQADIETLLHEYVDRLSACQGVLSTVLLQHYEVGLPQRGSLIDINPREGVTLSCASKRELFTDYSMGCATKKMVYAGACAT